MPATRSGRRPRCAIIRAGCASSICSGSSMMQARRACSARWKSANCGARSSTRRTAAGTFSIPPGAARAARRARRALFEYAIPYAALDAAAIRGMRGISASGTAHSSGAAGTWAASALISCWRVRPRRALQSIGSRVPQWRPAARRWLQQNARVLAAAAHRTVRAGVGESAVAGRRSLPPWRIGRGSIWPKKDFAPGSVCRI